jgi:hypothetical protein
MAQKPPRADSGYGPALKAEYTADNKKRFLSQIAIFVLLDGDNERKSAPSIIDFIRQKEKAATLLGFLTVYHAQVLSSKASERIHQTQW